MNHRASLGVEQRAELEAALPKNDTDLGALQQRLQAAEKTIAVLKHKVHALMSGAEKSIIEKQLVLAQKRSEAMDKRRELMELRATELEHYSSQLEGEVQERTRALRTILDHVTFGFLLIDSELRIESGYTRSCHTLLGTEALAGSTLPQVLGLSQLEEDDLRLGVEQVFEDCLPEDTSLAQLRTRFPVGERVLYIAARLVRDEAAQPRHLLLSVTDISSQERAELDTQRARALIEILRRREPFRGFVRDARDRLDQALASKDPTVVRSAVHTIKGNAACFGLIDVVAIARNVEDEGVLRGSIDAAGVRCVEQALRTYLDSNAAVLGIDLDDRADPGAVLAPAQLRRLVELTAGASPELRELVVNLVRRPASDLLGPVERLVELVATTLGKEVRFELAGGETLVDASLASVFGVIGHLLRNAVDHGIVEQGRVVLTVSETEGMWEIRVQDDGRGIDPERVAQRAVAKGLIDEQRMASMSADDKLKLILLDGLTTAQATTDISGRGVGMSAVREAVAKLDGTLRIQSAPGRGTCIEVNIPKPAKNQFLSSAAS
jgi:two-component system, chemotaxis family, sensor kinase CheA